jgi:hypothetical protein
MALWIIDNQPEARHGGVTDPMIAVIREQGHEVIETYHHVDQYLRQNLEASPTDWR